MYEQFFQLKRRPFAATPDANCWFHSEGFQAALDELLVCAEQGQGVGVLVGPPGIGKTLLCERLVREIGEPFTSVLLRHATYHSRRSFLQTLLSELAQPFDLPTDQELRLALAPVLRGLGQQGRALVLVVDEAHELNEQLLEELRILADQAQEGCPLVRLILCGNLGLEEKLAHPQLQALNQRVRAHVNLLSLTQAESADYLDHRITWSGGRTEELFTTDAVTAICQAADGIPRCLNQLADHALLTAFVADQKPTNAETISAALDDLQHLPLSWNRTLHNSSFEHHVESSFELGNEPSSDDRETIPAASHFDPVPTEPSEYDVEMAPSSVQEFDFGTDDWSPLQAEEPVSETIPEDLHSEASVSADSQLEAAPAEEEWQEEIVTDLYTALDAGIEPPQPGSESASEEHPRLENSSTFDSIAEDAADEHRAQVIEQSAADLLDAELPIDDRLQVVQHLVEYVNNGESPRTSAESHHSFADADLHVTEPATDSSQAAERPEERTANLENSHFELKTDPADASIATAVIEIGGPDPDVSPQTAMKHQQSTSVERPIRNLFTLLRLKQQGRL